MIEVHTDYKNDLVASYKDADGNIVVQRTLTEEEKNLIHGSTKHPHEAIELDFKVRL